MLGLFKALQNGLSQKTIETSVAPTNGRTTTVNPLSSRTQGSIESAAKFEDALEKMEGLDEALKREKRGATGTVEQQAIGISELNDLLRGKNVRIRPTAITDNYASFNVQGSYKGTIKSFAIASRNGGSLSSMTDNSTITVATNRGESGKFEPGDANHVLWSSILKGLKNIQPGTTYEGRKFLDLVPSIDKALLKTNNPLTSTVETTTPFTKATSTEGYVSPLSSTSSTRNTVSQYITKASQEVTEAISSTETPIINETTPTVETVSTQGAVSTSGTKLPVLNGTSVEEPTTAPAVSKGSIFGSLVFFASMMGVGVEGVTVAAATGGVGGALLLGLGAKMAYDYCYKKTGQYDLKNAPKDQYSENLQEAEQLLSSQGGNQCSVTMESTSQAENPSDPSSLLYGSNTSLYNSTDQVTRL